jgi:hypothetical protein
LHIIYMVHDMASPYTPWVLGGRIGVATSWLIVWPESMHGRIVCVLGFCVFVSQLQCGHIHTWSRRGVDHTCDCNHSRWCGKNVAAIVGDPAGHEANKLTIGGLSYRSRWHGVVHWTTRFCKSGTQLSNGRPRCLIGKPSCPMDGCGRLIGKPSCPMDNCSSNGCRRSFATYTFASA